MRYVAFEFTLEELNKAIYQCKEMETVLQQAKDDYEILDDSGKDLLASLTHKIVQSGDFSHSAAETEARTTKEWTDYKAGRNQAKRVFGRASLNYKHSERVLNGLTSGLAYKRELVKKGI